MSGNDCEGVFGHGVLGLAFRHHGSGRWALQLSELQNRLSQMKTHDVVADSLWLLCVLGKEFMQ